MKSMMKDTAIMFAITLVAGLILGAVYQITKDPIARQEEMALQEASRQVFASAASFETAADFDGQQAQEVLEEGGYPQQTIDGYQVALDEDGAAVGYVITVTSHEGYGGDIQFLMGVNSDGSLNGISLLSISETPGLGMQAEEVLVPQFQDRETFIYPFESTKTGAASESQIDAISGATITTDAVTNGVNAGLYYFQTQLEADTAGGEQDA